MDNKWEPLHRISTLQTIVAAIFGGPAVTAAIQAVLKGISQPSLPWWGYLVITAACSGVVLWVLSNAKRKDDVKDSSSLEANWKPEPNWKNKANWFRTELDRVNKEKEDLKEQHKSALAAEYQRGRDDERAYIQQVMNPPEPQLSDAQYHRFDKLRNQFAVLKPAQKIALKKVRDIPGITEFELFTYLTETLGFVAPVKENIIDPLLNDFVERNTNGEIELKTGKVDWIDYFLKQKPLC
jgi:hypothetical protein